MSPIKHSLLWKTLWSAVQTGSRLRFARQVSVLTLAHGLSALLTLLQGLLIARWLGPGDYGRVALILGYGGLVYSIFTARSGEASISYIGTFHTQGQPEHALAICQFGYVMDAGIALISAGCVALSARWAATTFIGQPAVDSLMSLYAFAYIPGMMRGTASAVLSSLEHFTLLALLEVSTSLLRFGLVAGLALTNGGITGVVWGNALALATSGILFAVVATRLAHRVWGNYWWHAQSHLLWPHMRGLLHFLSLNELTTLLGLIPKQLDIFMLGLFSSPIETGYYRLAKNLAGAVGYLVTPLQSVTYPDLARQAVASDRILVYQRGWWLATRVGLPLGLLIGLVGSVSIPLVLPLLAGSAFQSAVPATQILLIGYSAWLAFFWLRPFFLAQRWVKTWAICSGLFALTALAGWLVLVPEYGSLGLSSWWTIATLSVYLVPPLVWFFRQWQYETGNAEHS